MARASILIAAAIIATALGGCAERVAVTSPPATYRSGDAAVVIGRSYAPPLYYPSDPYYRSYYPPSRRPPAYAPPHYPPGFWRPDRSDRWDRRDRPDRHEPPRAERPKKKPDRDARPKKPEPPREARPRKPKPPREARPAPDTRRLLIERDPASRPDESLGDRQSAERW